ncbi:hypothetical protein HXX76_013427 [Chlamydomonas incerta]|uniref:Small ribosomal subunit protein uS7 domain-containing protein n=1 Tax=Chlamydomonas incerta TaxID=51695 RepID=A0A835VQT8_CHLIN|nr:hypothetical protein HXX76_013427 [Chlamydomonas incerta]|eukprot:KAG2425802.1 hypothetical protein HXX76_013427 [Chlamydomonas incerta]
MLSSARRLLASVGSAAVEQRALADAPAAAAGPHLRALLPGLAPPACFCSSTTALGSLGAAGSWRCMSSAADSAGSQQQPPPQQQQSEAASSSSSGSTAPAGPMSEVVQELTKASPTGRLLDLFTPSQQQQTQQTLQRSRGPGPRSRPGAGAAAGGGPGGAAGAGPQAAAEAAPPLAADSDVLEVVLRAVENCKPLMKVIQSKAGTRVVYQPRPLNPTQSTNFAVKWILEAAKKRRVGGKAGAGAASMADALAVELLLAAQRKGGARARRDEVHKLALDNRANLRR